MCKIFGLRPQTGNNKDSSIMAKVYRLHLDAAGNIKLEMKVWAEVQVRDLHSMHSNVWIDYAGFKQICNSF